jgi:hypothetical protein
MTAQQTIRSNGQDGPERPKDDLDQLFEVLESSDANEILEAVNSGLGNYDDNLLWSQTESYRKGLVAQTLVADVLVKRAIDEAKEYLADHGTAFFKDTDMDVKQFKPFEKSNDSAAEVGEDESTWTAKKRYAEKIWRHMDEADEAVTEEQYATIVKATGMRPEEWIPMFWDMFAGKHDMSRSHGAELLKLYLGDRYEFRGNEEDGEAKKRGILRGRS